jgi:hypothetical protein
MIPEVRQDCRLKSRTFGAVAVKLPDGSALGEYGVMTVDRGGSFATADQVKDWAVLINPGLAIEAGQ